MESSLKFISNYRGQKDMPNSVSIDFSSVNIPQPESVQQGGGMFQRLKESLMDLIFEEVEIENFQRPVGISQLSSRTFRGTQENPSPVFFQNTRPYQDYRYTRFSKGEAHDYRW